MFRTERENRRAGTDAQTLPPERSSCIMEEQEIEPQGAVERRRAPYTPVFLGVTEKSTELDVDRIADEIVTIATQSVSINLPKKWRSTEYQRLQSEIITALAPQLTKHHFALCLKVVEKAVAASLPLLVHAVCDGVGGTPDPAKVKTDRLSASCALLQSLMKAGADVKIVLHVARAFEIGAGAVWDLPGYIRELISSAQYGLASSLLKHFGIPLLPLPSETAGLSISLKADLLVGLAVAGNVAALRELVQDCSAEEKTSTFLSLRTHPIVVRRPKILALLSQLASEEAVTPSIAPEPEAAAFASDVKEDEGKPAAPQGLRVVGSMRGIPGPMFRLAGDEPAAAIPALLATLAAMPSLKGKDNSGPTLPSVSEQDQARFITGQRRSIKFMVSNDLLPLAVCYVGVNPSTQRLLLDELLRARRLEAVRSLSLFFKLTADYSEDRISRVVPGTTASVPSASRDGSYWRVPVFMDASEGAAPADAFRVKVVDTLLSLSSLAECFKQDLALFQSDVARYGFHILGIDVEWRPHTWTDGTVAYSGAHAWPASLLQIALGQRVYLVDLLTLYSVRQESPSMADLVDAAFAVSVGWVFTEATVCKIGFGLHGDVRKLCESYPCWFPAPYLCSPTLDISALFSSTGAAVTSNLSAITNQVLGNPLDKSQQTSDWQVRPLSSAQVEYAALDGVVLGQLFRNLAPQHEAPKGTETPHPPTILPLLSAVEISPLDLIVAPVFPQSAFVPHVEASARPPVLPTSVSVANPTECDVPVPPEAFSDTELSLNEVDFAQSAKALGLGSRIQAVPFSPSAADAAAALSLPLTHIVKSMGVIAEGTPIVVVVSGCERLSPAKLASALAISRRKVRLASPQECVRVFGYRPGCFGPIGHRRPFSVYISSALDQAGDLMCGAGSERAMIRLSFPELVSVTNGKVGDIAEPVTQAATSETSPPEAPVVEERKPEILPPASDAAPSVLVDLPLEVLTSQHRHPRFLIDNMMGRLVRWLRVVGVDTEFIPDRDHDLLAARAVREERIVLTRDRKFIERKRSCAYFFLPMDDTHSQFAMVTEHFGIVCTRADLMSRCARCNGEGYDKQSKEFVRATGRVQEKVLLHVEEFWACKRCKKLYWEGPKFESTRDMFEGLITEHGIDTTDDE